jgi:hypothetical protein
MKTKTRFVRKVFAHRYRSQRVGILFVGLTSSVGNNPKPLHLDFTHEFFPSQSESDEMEHRRVNISRTRTSHQYVRLRLFCAYPSTTLERRSVDVRFFSKQKSRVLGERAWHIHHTAVGGHKPSAKSVRDLLCARGDRV